LHDALNQWPHFLGVKHSLPGPVFNQTTLALDAALAGQGVALACQAFVASDLAEGRLIKVSKHWLKLDASYYLVRKRQPFGQTQANLIWDWCLQQFSSGGG